MSALSLPLRIGGGPSLLAALADPDEVLVADGMVHAPDGGDCPNDSAHRMAAAHAVQVLHLRRCTACYPPQGRAA